MMLTLCPGRLNRGGMHPPLCPRRRWRRCPGCKDRAAAPSDPDARGTSGQPPPRRGCDGAGGAEAAGSGCNAIPYFKHSRSSRSLSHCFLCNQPALQSPSGLLALRRPPCKSRVASPSSPRVPVCCASSAARRQSPRQSRDAPAWKQRKSPETARGRHHEHSRGPTLNLTLTTPPRLPRTDQQWKRRPKANRDTWHTPGTDGYISTTRGQELHCSDQTTAPPASRPPSEMRQPPPHVLRRAAIASAGFPTPAPIQRGDGSAQRAWLPRRDGQELTGKAGKGCFSPLHSLRLPGAELR